jgi:hypothetical protein
MTARSERASDLASEHNRKAEPQSLAGSPQNVDQQRAFCFMESFDFGAKVHADEENAVGDAQSMDIGHAGRVAPQARPFKEKYPRSEKH